LRAPADFTPPEHGQVWIDAKACRIDLFDRMAAGLPSAGREPRGRSVFEYAIANSFTAAAAVLACQD
jgi:hypothetical protein